MTRPAPRARARAHPPPAHQGSHAPSRRASRELNIFRRDGPLWVVGDVQGFLSPLHHVLTEAGLIDPSGGWTGGGATLAVLGDLVDRGPDGIGVIELLMRLQQDAASAGGRLLIVIGNHDVLLMAARKFGDAVSAATGQTLLENWLEAGGVKSDLERLTDDHMRWLQGLPAMSLLDADLLVHADSLFYLDYGRGVEDVNARFAEILASKDVAEWDRLLDEFAEHRAFFSGPDGCANLDLMLRTFGGQRLIHGHTPIARMTRTPPESVTAAYEYCAGRCVNVDPGLYLGGVGFAYRAA